jgi:threonine synthase
MRAYADWLPVTPATPHLTLYEGNTPLIPSLKLSELVGAKVYLKFEGLNPTGSFKDRGMVLAMAKAMEAGRQAVICASTGNTSASAAAYAARAGMTAFVLIPDGYVALGKLAQASIYGAKVVAVRGNFDRALELVQELADDLSLAVVNSVNPYRLDGQQTAAFEVCDVLGDAPDHLCIPVGNAGNISAYWKGFQAYLSAGKTSKTVHMHGFEAEGAAALVRGEPIANPETFATAIRIGNPASWKLAMAAVEESDGSINAVSDAEIAHAYQLIAKEGVFAEPGSAASVAGLLQLHRNGLLRKDETVVCVLTGNGLKDPDSAVRLGTQPTQAIQASRTAVRSALETFL